jgi:hypothetical protein
MDRCLTILPPRPPPLTAFRAAVGARWFAVISAFRRALRLARRASAPPPPPARMSEPSTKSVSLHAFHDTAPAPAGPHETPDDDKWLRPTEVLPLRG